MERSVWRYYTKRPVTITAMQWFKHNEFEPENSLVRYFRRPDIDGESICRECGKKLHVHGWIDTMEDGHRVCPNDWIIKGVKDEFYPIKPDIFKESYEMGKID